MPRGGNRPGSGRKLKDDAPREVLNCRVRKDTKDWFTSERERTGRSLGELVDLAADTLQASPKKQFPDAPVDED